MRTDRLIVAASLALSLLCPAPLPAAASPAWQEDLAFFATEAPVVVTAALHAQEIDKVPGTITVLTDKDIKASGAQTLIQVLALVPGFHVAQESYGPMVAVVRGYKFSSGHVKFMLDGHTLNNTQHQGMDVWQDMPLDNVKQIEVIRGPGSSLYGSDAFMAVVNVITRKDPGGLASATAGTLGRWGVSAGYNGASEDGKRGLRLSFNQFGEGGDEYFFEKDWLTGSPAYGSFSSAPMSKRKDQERFDAGAVATWGRLSLTLRHAQNVKQWTEGYVHIVNPVDGFITSRDTFVEAEYKLPIGGHSALTLKGSFDQDYMQYNHHSLPPFFPLGFGAEGGYNKSWITGHEYNGQSIFETERGPHNLTAGFTYNVMYFPETMNRTNMTTTLIPLPGMVEVSGQDPLNWTLAEHTSEEQWGAFAQDIWDLEPLTLILGARYDQYQLAGHAFAPRVALIWQTPFEQILKASFGQAFYAPFTSARYTQAFGFQGDPNLKPELVKTYELSMQNPFAGRFHYVTTFFYSVISDAFRFTTTRLPPLSAYYNEGQQHFFGTELEGRYEVTPGIKLWGNFSFAKGNDKVTDDNPSFPRRLANAGVTALPLESLAVTLHGQFVGESFRNKAGQTGDLAGWGVLNTSVVWRIGPLMDLQFSGMNLLDQDRFSYNDQGFIPAAYGSASPLTEGNDFPLEGRRLLFKATRRFGGN